MIRETWLALIRRTPQKSHIRMRVAGPLRKHALTALSVMKRERNSTLFDQSISCAPGRFTSLQFPSCRHISPLMWAVTICIRGWPGRRLPCLMSKCTSRFQWWRPSLSATVQSIRADAATCLKLFHLDTMHLWIGSGHDDDHFRN
jgi:hypothetical protein